MKLCTKSFTEFGISGILSEMIIMIELRLKK